MLTDSKIDTRLDTWIDEYVSWASKRSPLTPSHFHQNIALTIACANIARRVHVQLPHEKLYPNLYTLIVAVTTVHAKTTAFNLARDLIHAAMPDKMLTSVSTPEAFANELAGNVPSNLGELPEETREAWKASAKWGARRLFILDEAGRFFNALQRDYNATLDTILMELYDSPDDPISRQTNKQGLIHIVNPSLSCLFATTPGNIRHILSNRDSWSDGFWNRWNFVTADQPLVWGPTEFIPLPKDLAEMLRHISDELGTRDYSATLGATVNREFMEYSRAMRDLVINESDDRLHGVYGRLPTKRMKAALCLAVMQNSKHPEIKLSHWRATAELAAGWNRDALLAIQLSQRTDQSDLESRVWSLILEHNESGGLTGRRIQQITNKTAHEIYPILEKWVRMKSVRCKEEGKSNVYLANEK